MKGVVEDIGWRVCTTKDFFPTEPVAIYGGVVLDKDSVRAMEQKADNQGTLKSKTLQVESINKNGRKVKFFVDGTDEQSLMGLVFGRCDSKRFKISVINRFYID